jgi:hypothetical protein
VITIAALGFVTGNLICERSFQLRITYTVTLLLIIVSYHSKRKDLAFALKYFETPRLQMSAVYNVFILPFSLPLLFTSQAFLLPGLHALVSLVPLIEKSRASIRIRTLKLSFFEDHFEWISGIRRNLTVLVLLILFVLVLSPVKLFGPAALLLLNVVIISFYNESEPLSMLNARALAPVDFLREKNRFLTRTLLTLNFLPLLVNTLFHQDALVFNACLLVGFHLLASISLFMKYASYEPRESVPVQIDMLIVFFSVLVPYLLPLSIFIYYSKRKAAITNLQRFG